MAAVFARADDLFHGRYPGYQACDLCFHDWIHTIEVTAAVARLLDGNLKRGRGIRLHARDCDLLIAAALFHDIGYLKEKGDKAGTGAKFTPFHVVRGANLARRLLAELDVPAEDQETIRRLILWTGVNIDYDALVFTDEAERLLGCILGTGDLLGQMAAPEYPDRLDALYDEFKEASRTATGKAVASYTFATREELKKKTRAFYNHYVVPVLEGSYRGVFHDLGHHFADGQNHYILRIEENIGIIEDRLAAAST